MLLLSHILIALASLVYSTYLLISPARAKFYISYSLVGLTLVSGTYLVISSKAQLMQSCLTGLVYLAIVSTLIVLARFRLQTAKF